MLKNVNIQQQSFDIHLTSNMQILFIDNYSSQFNIVDDKK